MIAEHSDVLKRNNQYEECEDSFRIKVGYGPEEYYQRYVMVAMIVRYYSEFFVKHKNNSLYHESYYIKEKHVNELNDLKIKFMNIESRSE